ncbi:MAG: hypothetical protein Q9209_005978 [Squamulea sp. 1 TL-2023]
MCVAAVPWLGHNRGPEVIGALTTLTILAAVAVALRFLARSISGSKYGWDDWLILFALVWEFGMSTTQLFAVHYGFGRHMLMLDGYQVTQFSKLFFTTGTIFSVACTALKFSVLAFYHRIFPIRKFTVYCIIIAAIVVAWFIAFVVTQFVTCQPFEYWWDKSIPGGHCINGKHVGYYITSPPDILTNIAILVLPIPWLWDLQMQTRRKIAITCIFILGSFAALGSIIRVPYLHQLNFNDPSYSVVSPGIWLNVEIAIGILSASLPLMRPLFSRAFPSQVLSRWSRSRTNGSQRLRDLEASGKISGSNSGKMSGSRNSHVKGLGDNGIYAGQNKKQPHKSWYNAKAAKGSSKGGGTGRGSEGGSEEDMVPMGNIQVRQDVEWEREQEAAKGEGTGTPDTLR